MAKTATSKKTLRNQTAISNFVAEDELALLTILKDKFFTSDSFVYDILPDLVNSFEDYILNPSESLESLNQLILHQVKGVFYDNESESINLLQLVATIASRKYVAVQNTTPSRAFKEAYLKYCDDEWFE